VRLDVKNERYDILIVTESTTRTGLRCWYLTCHITNTTRRVRITCYTKDGVLGDISRWKGPVKFRLSTKVRLREVCPEDDVRLVGRSGRIEMISANQADNKMHASAPMGLRCADCTMDGEACPLCYAAWWRRRHPNTVQVPEAAGVAVAAPLVSPSAHEAHEAHEDDQARVDKGIGCRSTGSTATTD